MKKIAILSDLEWLEPALPVFTALSTNGGIARAVGGCVRDSILGRTITDIDIATNLTPTQSSELLENAGIEVVPVGIDHGSILAIVNGRSFDITTLRVDVKSHGRHATIEFTDNWLEDAKRRDFTMNALYMDVDGSLYDPCDGIEDIKNGKVRFIGSPRNRIKEDYLRILRLFRFQAHYGSSSIDEEALTACEDAKDKLDTLSGERIWSELKKLLLSLNCASVVEQMQSLGLFQAIFGISFKVQALKDLVMNESILEIQPSAIRHLSALVDASHKQIASRLHMSAKEQQQLSLLARPTQLETTQDIYRILYKNGAETCQDLLLLQQNDMTNLMQMLGHVRNWHNPKLPIQGRDLVKMGIPEGPEIGGVIQDLSEWWFSNACIPDRDECIAWLKTYRNKL